jgi:kynurenine formamidase
MSRWVRYSALRATLWIGLLILAACAVTPAAQPPMAGYSRMVDLSHVVREDVPHPPGEPPTRLERGPDGALIQLQLGVHTGSLLRIAAAPGALPADLEALSPRDLVLPAVLIDVRDQVQDQADFVFDADDVLAWERTYGHVPRGALVLLATGWDVRWGDSVAYLDAPPGLHPAAADLLINQRGAVGLGLDGPALNVVPASGFTLLLENLTSLEQLPPQGATVMIGALRLQAAESAPARVIALIP